jgi:hypothetical protein
MVGSAQAEAASPLEPEPSRPNLAAACSSRDHLTGFGIHAVSSHLLFLIEKKSRRVAPPGGGRATGKAVRHSAEIRLQQGIGQEKGKRKDSIS